jgi:two-component system response regulator AlgR
MTLKVLIVDDEAQARSRLRALLAECGEPRAEVVGEAAHPAQALALARRQPCDVVLLDLPLPGVEAEGLAAQLRALEPAPALVFVAPSAAGALEAEVAPCLAKPVRRDHLQAILRQVQRQRRPADVDATGADDYLLIQERGRSERVALADVIYLKAELKYITVRTPAREYIYDGALSTLEARYPQLFVRVHRNALVARRCVRAIEKVSDPHEGEGWAVRLDGVEERLAVSRRQLATVREVLANG